jgi:hypothetical protein
LASSLSQYACYLIAFLLHGFWVARFLIEWALSVAIFLERDRANENKRDTGYKWSQTVVESVEMMKVRVKIRISLGRRKPWGPREKAQSCKVASCKFSVTLPRGIVI